MRVIAGFWRGRRLVGGRGLRIRPTSDMVKGAMFSILGTRIQGATVVDLCCGAGCLGIEALSRGADFVHFVDRTRDSLILARENLARCGAPSASHRLHKADALRWLARRQQFLHQAPVIILADPPYAGQLASQLLVALLALPAEVRLDMAILEHESAGVDVPQTHPRFRISRRRYGATALTILEV